MTLNQTAFTTTFCLKKIAPVQLQASQILLVKKYTGTIVIPSTVQDNNGEDYTVTGIGNYAFMDCVKLQNIVLPNTIQEVGYSAFNIRHGNFLAVTNRERMRSP